MKNVCLDINMYSDRSTLIGAICGTNIGRMGTSSSAYIGGISGVNGLSSNYLGGTITNSYCTTK